MDYASAFARASLAAEGRGIRVAIADVPDPNTGDLDGTNVIIDQAEPPEARLFLLAHLFGHCVQWNTSPESRRVGQATFVPTTPAEFAAVEEYEKQASRYGLQLLVDAGLAGLDRWLTDRWQADWRFLEHFYRTGERRLDLPIPDRAPALEPLAIPDFVPARWPARFAI
jgi:hypothetical protein